MHKNRTHHGEKFEIFRKSVTLQSNVSIMDKENKDLKTLGTRFKDIRLMFGMTQAELAAKMGVTQLTVTRMENGTSISAGALLQFLHFYRQYVSIDILLDDKAWNMTSQDKEMLMRKPHMNSIVHEKLDVMKENMERNIDEAKAEMNRTLNKLDTYLKRGMESSNAILEE